MEPMEKVKTLQALYAGVLADAVLRMGKEGILEKVTAQKAGEQLLVGKQRAAQMGIETKEDVFVKLADLMGCADWKVTPKEDGFTATASRCMLCAMAKRLGAESPCHIYCLDPMKGMVKGLDPDAEMAVVGTLFEGSECRVEITR